jgi:hypothetical protein
VANYDTIPGAIANGDMSTMQFLCVRLTGSTTIDFEIGLCTAAGHAVIGVLQNAPNTSGHGAEVARQGVFKARVNQLVNPGNRLGPAADGMLAPVTAGGTTGETTFAVALQTGTASNSVIYVMAPAPYQFHTTA